MSERYQAIPLQYVMYTPFTLGRPELANQGPICALTVRRGYIMEGNSILQSSGVIPVALAPNQPVCVLLRSFLLLIHFLNDLHLFSQ